MALARDVLGGALEQPSFSTSLHAWMPASELEAERIFNRAWRQGVRLTPPSAPVIDGAHGAGLRLCLNAPPDRSALERALHVVAEATAESGDSATRSVI
jgi:hypothetical protein